MFVCVRVCSIYQGAPWEFWGWFSFSCSKAQSRFDQGPTCGLSDFGYSPKPFSSGRREGFQLPMSVDVPRFSGPALYIGSEYVVIKTPKVPVVVVRTILCGEPYDP